MIFWGTHCTSHHKKQDAKTIKKTLKGETLEERNEKANKTHETIE